MMMQHANEANVPKQEEEDFKDASKNHVRLRIRNETMHTNEGHFSSVYRAQVTQIVNGVQQGPGMDMAMKKMIVTARTKFRELFILRQLATTTGYEYRHRNIMELMYSQKKEYNGNVVRYTLVSRFIPNTLAHLKTPAHALSVHHDVVDIKLYAWQLFAALDHLRRIQIIHRDIKPSNLLADPRTGRLTIADFGSAIFRPCHTRGHYGFYAVTRHYRAPELLLRTKRYDFMIDVWAAGCVLAELYLGEPLRTDDTNDAQLQRIYEMFGMPSVEELAAMHIHLSEFRPGATYDVVWPYMELATKFEEKDYGEAENPTDFLLQILKFNPDERLHGPKLLADPFFDELFQPDARRRIAGPGAGAFVSETIADQDCLRAIGTEV